MILVDNYILAIICCCICCICWGSWANTQKLVATPKWSFELYYWDFTWGVFLTALVGALLLGGPVFIDNIAHLDLSSAGCAMLGGIVWNFANIFLTAAIAIAGMSVGFPIGGGLGWIGGIIFNYLLVLLAGQSYPGNQALLWIGVVIIIVAIYLCGNAYGKLATTRKQTPTKGIMLAVISGIGLIFFYGLVVKSLDPMYVNGGTGTLAPYTGVFFFALGVLISTPIFNTFVMRHPFEGNKTTFKDYLAGSSRTHLIGMLGGLIWMGGMLISFMGSGAANPAISYALSNAAPIVAMIWGVWIWKEFKGASKGTYGLIGAMFTLFIVGLVLITLSN